MNKLRARAILNDVLTKERSMRAYVFRFDTKKRDAKVAEIDLALEALAVLVEAAGATIEQPGLFGGEGE